MSKSVRAILVTFTLLVMMCAVAFLAVYIYSHNMFNVQCLVEHDVALITAKPATCTEYGCTNGAYCKRCGKVLVESNTVKPVGHSVVVTKGKSPNCVSEGTTDKKECATCGLVIEPHTSIAALGHDWERNTETYIEKCRCGEANPTKQILTAEQIYNKCAPAVCLVFAYDSSGAPIASGSGFFVNSKGDVLTNYHVISMGRSFEILTSEGERFAVDGIFDYDPQADWAILHLDANSKSFPFLIFGTESSITNGATVYAIGNPLGVLTSSITQGIISNNSRTINGVRYIQMSAAISHGSSGGALINQHGEVIGITTASIEQGQSLNLSVPIPEKLTETPFNIYRLLDSGNMVQESKNNFLNWLNSFKSLSAFKMLANWIKANPSFVEGDTSVYCDTESDGDAVTYCFINSEPNGDILIILLLKLDGEEYSLRYEITNDLDDLYCTYTFFDGKDLVGFGRFYTPTFYPEQEIAFGSYTGIVFADLQQSYEDMCSVFITATLDTLNDLLSNKMKNYGLSMESFGFFNYN